MNILKHLLHKLGEHLNITPDKENEQTVIANIRRNVEFRGVNLWILIFAVLIASIGLNIDSTPVIIGAMLISPIMGPIIGTGLSVGINDMELMKRSLRNLLVAAVFAIVAAAIYFWISPINEGQSELLARTSPTLYDVMIAFIGGAAGFLAMSTTGNHIQVIIGVAISTALMPPLCTVGFGIATGKWLYAIGALYLFFINSVFIAISTFISVRFFKFAKKEFTNKLRERHVRRSLIIISITALCPSVILTYNIVRKTIFTENAQKFIENELKFPDTEIINSKIDYDSRSIEIVFIGRYIPPMSIETAEEKLSYYHLDGTTLNIMQDGEKRDNIPTGSMQNRFINYIYKKSESREIELKDQIDSLQNIISGIYGYEKLDSAAYKEINVLFPNVKRLTLGYAWTIGYEQEKVVQYTFALIEIAGEQTAIEKSRIEEWIKQRTNNRNIRTIWTTSKQNKSPNQ